jgi:hypothetical protein
MPVAPTSAPSAGLGWAMAGSASTALSRMAEEASRLERERNGDMEILLVGWHRIAR